MCLTDGEECMLPLMEENAQNNGLDNCTRVQRLRWGDADDMAAAAAAGPYDLVVGSDLLYAPEVFPELLETVGAIHPIDATDEPSLSLPFPAWPWSDG